MIAALTSMLAAALPTIAPAISAFIAKIPPTLLPELIAKVAEILIAIGKEIFLCKDSVDELGYKAVHAEKKPEDFSTKTAFVRYLNDNVAFDQVAYDALSESKKLELKVAGTLIYSMALNEHLGVAMSPATLVAFSAMNIEPKSVLAICDKLASIGEKTTELIDKTMEGTGSIEDIDKGLAILKNVLFGTGDDADRRLDDMIVDYEKKLNS